MAHTLRAMKAKSPPARATSRVAAVGAVVAAAGAVRGARTATSPEEKHTRSRMAGRTTHRLATLRNSSRSRGWAISRNCRICPNNGQGIRNISPQVQAFAGKECFDDGSSPFNNVGDLNLFFLQTHTVSVDLAQVEDIVDQMGDVASVAIDHFDILAKHS